MFDLFNLRKLKELRKDNTILSNQLNERIYLFNQAKEEINILQRHVSMLKKELEPKPRKRRVKKED